MCCLFKFGKSLPGLETSQLENSNFIGVEWYQEFQAFLKRDRNIRGDFPSLQKLPRKMSKLLLCKSPSQQKSAFLRLLAVQPGLILNHFVSTSHMLCSIYWVRVLWKPEKFCSRWIRNRAVLVTNKQIIILKMLQTNSSQLVFQILFFGPFRAVKNIHFLLYGYQQVKQIMTLRI